MTLDRDPFDGKTWAITGTLPGMTRAQAAAALKDRGAKVSKSVSSRTDVLVSVGYNPSQRARFSSKELKARQNNVTIINEAQFNALLKGEPLAKVVALESKPAPRAEMPTRDALASFRDIVYDDPTPHTWESIWRLIDQCSDEDLPLVVDYLEGHLANWPLFHQSKDEEFRTTLDTFHGSPGLSTQRLRQLPREWLPDLFLGIDSPKLRLARSANFMGAKMTGKIGIKVLECTSLSNLTHLNLTRNKLSGKFFEALRGAPHLQSLKELHFNDSTLSESAINGLIGDATWRPTHLSLRGAVLQGRGLPLLLQSPCWASLKSLDLRALRYNPNDPTRALADAPHIDQLEHLRLDHCRPISARNFRALMTQSHQMAQLRTLSLVSDDITDDHIAALNDAPHIEKLRALSLTQSCAGPALASLLRRPIAARLTHLTLSGREGVMAALANSRVRPRQLTICGGFTLDARRALMNSEIFASVRTLRLELDIEEPDDIREFVIDLIQHPQLRKLRALTLIGLDVDDAILQALIDSERWLSTMHMINLVCRSRLNKVTKIMAQRLIAAASSNPILHKNLERSYQPALR